MIEQKLRVWDGESWMAGPHGLWVWWQPMKRRWPATGRRKVKMALPVWTPRIRVQWRGTARTIQLKLQANSKGAGLQAHTLGKSGGPILLSVATLRFVGALLDFENELLTLRALDSG